MPRFPSARNSHRAEIHRGVKPLLQCGVGCLCSAGASTARMVAMNHVRVMMRVMTIVFGEASETDAAAVAALRMAAARDLTARFGGGTWSFAAESEASVRAELLTSAVLFAREEGVLVGTLRLTTKNPWLGHTDFFTPCARPVYLTSMAVAPKWRRCGIGRKLLDEARRKALELRGEAIRLDSYNAAAGAGDFYRKCGFREVRRGDYNGTPLIWFEAPLT
jgi:GNAT superfamily N-acetyltransferase